jgi:hypothetical protein
MLSFYCKLIFLVILCIGHFSTITFAEENSNSNHIPLIVTPIYPNNQNPEIKGYFDLNVYPGTTQTLLFQVKNNKEFEIEVKIQPSNGYTHPTGGIIYKENHNSPDSFISDERYKMASNIKTPELIKIQPNETVEVPVEITVPQLNKGELVGGVRFLIDGDGSKKEQPGKNKKEASFQIKTLISTNIGIKLNLPEQAESSFDFGEVGFIGKSTQGYVELINDAAKIQDHINAEYVVYDDKGVKVFSNSFAAIKMAPKTTIRYQIPWEAPKIKAGEYRIEINGDVDGQPLFVERVFQVNVNELIDYQQQTVPAGTPEAELNVIAFTMRQLISYMIAILVLIIGGVFLGIKISKAKSKDSGHIYK